MHQINPKKYNLPIEENVPRVGIEPTALALTVKKHLYIILSNNNIKTLVKTANS